MSDSVLAAWCAVHNLTPKWLGAVSLSWLALLAFAAIAIPLKYPYEARGQILDSGVVIGLVIPLAVMNLALEEGPRDLVVLKVRSLACVRTGLVLGFLGTAAALSLAVSSLAEVPIRLVVTDTLGLASLTILGTSLLGNRLGWIPALGVVLLMSMPGLVPWQFNLIYQRDVGIAFTLVVMFLAFLAIFTHALLGSVGIRDRSVS